MKISELKAKQSKVEITGEILSVGEIRKFDKYGKELRVANAELKDDSGTIKLTLWNEEIEKVKAGDKVKITNGYVNEWQGEIQLTAGRFGKLEVI